MVEDVLYKSEEPVSRQAIAAALRAAAEQIETGTLTLGDGPSRQDASIPERPTFEVELERLTDAETGEHRYELEYEIRWTA